jgi:hypothetical protein
VVSLSAVGRVFLDSSAFFEEGFVHAPDYTPSQLNHNKYSIRYPLCNMTLGSPILTSDL